MKTHANLVLALTLHTSFDRKISQTYSEQIKIVQGAWNGGGNEGVGLAKIKDKIKACRPEPKAWGIGKSNRDTEAIKQLQKRIDSMIPEEVTADSRAEYLEVSKKLDDLLLKQEVFWAQRSRISWFKHGDKNTKFFHTKATQRRRRNHIQRIKNFDNCWVEEVHDIAKVANDYFANLFTAGTCSQIDECLSAIPLKVTPNIQHILTSDFTVDEIKAALF